MKDKDTECPKIYRTQTSPSNYDTDNRKRQNRQIDRQTFRNCQNFEALNKIPQRLTTKKDIFFGGFPKFESKQEGGVVHGRVNSAK